MKKILLAGMFTMLCCVYYAGAQNNSDDLTGAQILRAARAIYDQGRLHELPAVLEAAVKKGGRNAFTQSEKIEAYQILILTYIYLEEPQKADDKMVELLRTDHFFELSDSDPVEFRNLYNKFRHDPLFRIGIKFGVNQTQVNVIKNYFVSAESQANGKYVSNLGIQFGVVFEKDFKKKFVINPEILYNSQSFTYKNTSVYFIDYDSLNRNGSASHTINQTRVQTNLLMQYKIGNSKFFTYVAVGPAIGYLLSSGFTGTMDVQSREPITGSDIDTKMRYKSVNLSGVIAAGARYKIGGIFVSGDVRYQYGFLNIVNTDNRYKHDTPDLNDQITRYHYVDNDFSLNQIMINVGLIYPFFSPKKLIK
jgi:hypothetical protein